MTLEKEVSMATEDSKIYVRRRKRGSAEQDEPISLLQSRWGEGHGLEREKKEDLISEDEAAKRLINLELDGAEALAELWRMAREPSQQGNLDAHLCWSSKRIRTSLLSKKDSIASCKPKEEPEDATSSAAKNRSSCISERDSMVSDREEIESKSDLRAESPSSHLPSLQLPHGAFLPRGNPTAKSAFQRVLPMVLKQRPYLLPVKSEIEEVQLDGFDVRPRTDSARRKLRSPTNPRECKGAASPDMSGTKSELCSFSDLVVFSNPKPACSEKEKEARKLLRVQANRESARQTIRRKQVECDELTKRASSLAFENEGMKQKRELLMQKLFYLRGENYHLKQQLEREASGNMALLSAELPLKTLSDSASVPAFQVPSLPYARFPAHTLAWAMAAAQVTAPNQAHTFYNKEKPSDAVHADFFVLQHPAAAMALQAMPSSSKEAPVLQIVEHSPSHGFNGVCSPASMWRSSQNKTSFTKLECTESCTPQSEGAPCDPSSTTTVVDLGSTDDVPEESACLPANYSSSQLSSPTTCSSQATMPEIAVALDSMEGYTHSRTTQAAKSGYTYDDSKGGHFFNVHSLITNDLRGRNPFAIVAAAEARKRRKELTRQKFLRPRARRVVILADNTKEN